MSITDYVIFIERRALQIKNSLGTRAAAGFLRNRGVPLSFALRLLAR